MKFEYVNQKSTNVIEIFNNENLNKINRPHTFKFNLTGCKKIKEGSYNSIYESNKSILSNYEKKVKETKKTKETKKQKVKKIKKMKKVKKVKKMKKLQE